MTFSITILGSNSAVPAFNRHPSAQVVNIHEKLFLIDCGEGTQMRFNRHHVKKSKIDQIFISHLHGDHYFGLIGLINTYELMGRTKDLTIFAPKELQEIIELQLNVCGKKELKFNLEFVEIDCNIAKLIYENEEITVETIPLKHSIPCCGFLFREKEFDRKMIKEYITKYDIPINKIAGIKKGADFIQSDGTVIENKLLTTDPNPPRSFAYCSDTAYNPDMLDQVKGVNLMYHESTFINESVERAQLTKHSTAEQAAKIASQAEVKTLLLGHFSAKYLDLEPFIEESKTIFENVHLATEGKCFDIPFI